ncbi:MAG: cell envelope integrity protein TolA [Desulfurivibrionaceae bacterium]|nr:cell envelope integrity protein TolA [Desulfurivibrionaceae bacterium]
MRSGFQEFFSDLVTFFRDPPTPGNSRTVSQGFTGFCRDIRADRYRKIPLVLTVTFHLAVLLFSIVTPFLMGVGTPKIPEVYTVNLYRAPVEAAPPAPVVVKVTAPTRKKAVVKPVKEEIAVAPPVKKEAVSLAPVRQRLVEELKEKEARKLDEELRRRQIDQLKMEFMRDRAEKAAEQAEQTLAEAKTAGAARIAELYRTSDYGSRNHAESTAGDTGKSGPSPQELEALGRYKARLFSHISPHWQLPELQEWDESLRAVIVMNVNRDGTVTSSYFEKRSGNARFDKYAEKAIASAHPLPPFPLDFHEKSEEIVVTFSPGGLI